MTRKSDFASGVVVSFLKRGNPIANPKPVIEEAFRPELQHWRLTRTTDGDRRARELLYDNEARYEPS